MVDEKPKRGWTHWRDAQPMETDRVVVIRSFGADHWFARFIRGQWWVVLGGSSSTATALVTDGNLDFVEWGYLPS